MNEKTNIRNRWLHLRLSEEEYRLLQEQFSKTTERKLSKYARKILLGNPMIGGYRNLTSESLVDQFTNLVKTLNGVANNFNQTVHKLHTLKAERDIKNWIEHNQTSQARLLQNIETIKHFIKENSQTWLQ